MSWFTDLKNMQASGSSLSSTVTFSSLFTMMASCERDYLIPYVGQTTADLIFSKKNDNAANPDENRAVALYKTALAYFVDYKFPTFRSIEQGEAGPTRVETADKKTPFKYQETRLEKGNLHEGYEALEELLLHLETSATYKTAWKLTPQYKKARSVFAYCATVCREGYGYGINRHTYETLKPCIQDAHRFQTRKQLPAQFYADLMAKFKADTLNENEKTVVDFLVKIETYYAVEAAMYKQFVQIDGANLVTKDRKFANDGYQQESLPTLDEWRVAHTYHNEVAISYAKELKEFVIAEKTNFPKAIHTDAGGQNADADAWLKNEVIETPQYKEEKVKVFIEF